jgi:GxxExxY protein
MKDKLPPVPQHVNDLAGRVVDAAFQVHRAIGPGLLESVYEGCLGAEFRFREIDFERQIPIPIYYRDILIEGGLRLDFQVESTLIIELKAVELVLPVHLAQLLSYLRLSDQPLGLLINFNVALIRDGIHRIINPSWSGFRTTNSSE